MYHLFHKNLYSNIEYWFGVPELITNKIYYDGEFSSIEEAKASIGHIEEIPSQRTDDPSAFRLGNIKGTDKALKVESFINNDKYTGTYYVIYKGPIELRYKTDPNMNRYLGR